MSSTTPKADSQAARVTKIEFNNSTTSEEFNFVHHKIMLLYCESTLVGTTLKFLGLYETGGTEFPLRAAGVDVEIAVVAGDAVPIGDALLALQVAGLNLAKIVSSATEGVTAPTRFPLVIGMNR